MKDLTGRHDSRLQALKCFTSFSMAEGGSVTTCRRRRSSCVPHTLLGFADWQVKRYLIRTSCPANLRWYTSASTARPSPGPAGTEYDPLSKDTSSSAYTFGR